MLFIFENPACYLCKMMYGLKSTEKLHGLTKVPHEILPVGIKSQFFKRVINNDIIVHHPPSPLSLI